MSGTTSPALPTPEQMRNYLAAVRATWRTRRLREASRAIITGNIAAAVCLTGVILSVIHSDWFSGIGPFVVLGMLFAYLVGVFLSLSWMKRQRSHSSVTVLDRREAEAQQAPAQPVRLVIFFLACCAFQALCVAFWRVAFRFMSNEAILAALAVAPVLAAGSFVYRFLVFRFWEDLLFAAAVVMSYTPFFVQTWPLTPLSLLSFLAVIVGTTCLHWRWSSWARSLPEADGEGTVEEGRP